MKRTEEVPKLACPHCGGYFSRVVESDAMPDGTIKRTRLCLDRLCRGRYVTVETITRALSKPSAPDHHAA